MNKKRALKNMDIEEVSLVDRPANKRKFLLIKREDGEITELTIKTDGTFNGTTLEVNGEPVENLTSFWFAAWPPDDFDEGMVNGSYSVSETDGAEFDRETTFNLKKGNNTMKLATILKELGIDPDSLDAERTQDLDALVKFIDHMPPDDAARTLNVIKASLVKEEAPAPEHEGEETPVETDDLSSEEVAEIKSAMSRLNGMLPESERAVIKSEEPSELAQVLTAIKGLAKSEDDPSDNNPADPPVSEKEILQSLIQRLAKVEKTTGVSDDDGDEEGGGGEEYSAPDAQLTEEERIKKYGSKYPKALTDWGYQLQQ